MVSLQRITPGVRQVNGRGETRQDFHFRYKGTDVSRLEFVGYDVEGKLLGARLRNYSGGGAEGGTYTVGFTRPPASVTAKVITGLEYVEYPFRLENIPLPSHDRMPDKLEPAHFPGREEPVTVRCVKILSRGQFPKLEFQAVNHADKDVRKLHLHLYYLDGQGKTLKDWPITQAGQTPGQAVSILVRRRDSAVFRTTAFFMPRETNSVRVVLRQVDFMDATEWKASPPSVK